MASTVKSRLTLAGTVDGVDKAKRSAFVVLATLGEHPTPHHARVTNSGQLRRLLTVVFDAIALLALCTLGTARGHWHDSWSWLTDLKAPHIVTGAEDAKLFHVVFSGACCLVWLLVVGCGLLLWLEYRDRGLQSRATLVRATVSVKKLVEPLVVPILTILATPLSCSDLQYFLGPTSSCSGAEAMLMVVFAAVTLLVWLPLQFTFTLLLVEQDPNSPRVTAAVNGRAQMYGLIGRVVLALGPAVAPHVIELWVVAAALGFMALAVFVFQSLPFYHAAMNRFQCAVAATAAFICIGSLVSLVSDGMAFNQGFTTTWFLCAMIPMAIGACLPNLRYRQLKVRLAQVRDPMLTALAMYHQQSGHTFDVAAASHHTLEVTSTRIAPSLADIASRRSSIEFLAGRVREARLVQTRMPLGQADNASVDSDQPETAAPTHEEPPSVPIFDGAAPFEVELIVRMLLAQPGSTESRYRARGLGARGATVPTTQAVEQALWLYAAAIEEFRDDPVDLALVKIEYSRFVHCFTADLNLATSALDAAERERPGLEGSFAIFTRLKQLARQRAARNNGFVSAEDGDRASLDYTKRLSASLQLHENALKHRSRMYRAIQVRQGTFSADDQSMADRLGGIIDAVTEATSEANRNYNRLLKSHPNGVGLARCYSMFCDDVLNDTTQANEYRVSTSTSDGNSTSGGSKNGGQSILSNAQRSIASGVPTMRTLVPRPRTAEVDRIDVRFKIGMLVLLVATAVMFTTSHVIFEQVRHDLLLVKESGILQTSAVNAVLHTRLLSMHPSEEELSATRKSMHVWKDMSELVFKDTYDAGVIGDRWFESNLPMKTWRLDSTSYTENWNLWDATHRLVADVDKVIHDAESGVMQDPHKHTEWRFVMDNSVTVVAPALEELSQLMEDDVFFRDKQYELWAGVIVGFICITLLCLAFVFGVALKRVIIINRGVNEVALKLSPLDVSTLLRRTANALANIKKQRASIMQSLLDGDDADRGLGDVDNFTFDADKDNATKGLRTSTKPGLDSPPGAGAGKDRTTAFSNPAPARRQRVSFAPSNASIIADRLTSLTEGSEDEDESLAGAQPSPARSPPPAVAKLVPVNSKSNLLLEAETEAPAKEGRFNLPATPRQVTDAPGFGDIDNGDAKASPPSSQRSALSDEETKGTPADSTQEHEELQVVVTNSSAPTPATSDADSSDDEDGGLLGGSTMNLLALPQTASNASLLESVGVGSSRQRLMPLASAGTSERPPRSGGCPVMHHKLSSGKGSTVRFASSDTADSCPVDSDSGRRTSLSVNGGASASRSAHELPSGLSVESVVAASPGVVVVSNAVGVVKYVNPAFTRLLGYTSAFIVGKNVTTFQPPEIAEKHHLLMKRLVDGGKPKVVGVAGRHVAAIHENGSTIPVLLEINRVDIPGDGIYFVASLQDARSHAEGNEEEDESESGTGRQNNKYLALVVRVGAALLFVAALQALNFGYGVMNLRSAAMQVAEVNKASWVHTAGVRLALAAQELAIGDEEVWSKADNLAFLDTTLHTYEHTRFALRYGDSDLRLAGSAGRDPKLDLLHFGGVTDDGGITHGLDPMMSAFERHIASIVHRFSADPPEAPFGANYTRILTDPDLGEVEAAIGGEFNVLLVASIDEYEAESSAKVDSVTTFDNLANVGNAVVVIMLYVFVLKSLMLALRGTARRTEYMLLGFPEDFAGEGPLKRFFMRTNDLSVSA